MKVVLLINFSIYSLGRSNFPVRKFWAVVVFGVLLGMMASGAVAGEKGGSFLLIMDPPVKTSSTRAWELLKRSGRMDAVVGVLQASFVLPKPLTIHFGDGEGPVYDPGRAEILLPYGFVGEVAGLLADSRTRSGDLDLDTLDVVEWALYHELAHAFVDLFNLPVLGREEDAADALATLLAIELVENGGQIALTAADLLARISGNPKVETNISFWNEHSMNRQRFSQVVCWVYGSDTRTFAALTASAGIPKDRAQKCPGTFAMMANDWWRLLDRYLKPV